MSGARPIVLQDVTLSHDRRLAVGPVSGCIDAGALLAVVGPNGGGKTTLLRALAGLHRLDTGRIDRGGLDPGRIALLPQASALDRSFPLSCIEIAALGHWSHAGAFRALTRAELDAAAEALDRVGLSRFASRPVAALSAGQFQRVLFARLIVQDAPVLLLDEPFSAVDERTEDDLLSVIRAWHEDGRTVLAVLHDIDLVERFFPEALLLAREPVAWGPTASVLSAANRHRARLSRAAWAADTPQPHPHAA